MFALLVLLLPSTALAQTAFDVASVKPSAQPAGPDHNNRIAFSPTGFTARNTTLRKLIAEADHLQLSQVTGPGWLDQSEYDIEARASVPVSPNQLPILLRALLEDRFQLKQHRETRSARVYELVVDKGGPKIHAVTDTGGAAGAAGFHFRGEMRDFADLLAVQLNIPATNDPSQPARATGPPTPVLDHTGLLGVYDFSVKIPPELGTDMFTLWQRALPEQLGLRLISRRSEVEVVVVDSAARVPSPN